MIGTEYQTQDCMLPIFSQLSYMAARTVCFGNTYESDMDIDRHHAFKLQWLIW